ncbi:hypothetical protein RHMOL_Rhmol02G0149300 [Rhododendron molle]|uniref:Uncharacterized protein n=1 Tax=Rhododendron molle TaxID=49168 RepID=A0ACC0PQL3_RHOML|nr:hypothetical protein RHMOL_Rhmol02G0149300 [Rhododendron molle]
MILIIPSSNLIPNKHTHYQSHLLTNPNPNPISLRIPSIYHYYQTGPKCIFFL